MSIHLSIHGSGKPLVLFHGWGFNSHIWTPILPALENNHQLYLVDLPGFGLTPSMDWETFKIDLLNVLPAQFALAGWSMGGLFATRLAIEAPLRISHLLNIASSPRLIREAHWPGVDEKIFNNFYLELTHDPQKTLQQFIKLQLQNQPIPAGVWGEPPSLQGLQQGLDLFIHWDLRESLYQLTMPVYFIFGRLDAIIPRGIMTVMQGSYPNFQYTMLAKAAHAPFLSHTKEFINALEGFLS